MWPLKMQMVNGAARPWRQEIRRESGKEGGGEVRGERVVYVESQAHTRDMQ